MKRTQFIELFANIKKTFVSFFSIMLFVAIGMDVFLGLNWAPPALQNAAQSYYDAGSLHNFQMQYMYGLTEAELKEIAKIDGVTNVEAVHQSFQTLEGVGNSTLTAKVQTLPKHINMLTVQEGELPTKANEIALNSSAANAYGLKVGDTITFVKDGDKESQPDSLTLNGDSSAEKTEQQGDKDGMKYLTCSKFKVTALVDSPEFLAKASNTYGFSNSVSGVIDLLAWVSDDTFDTKAYMDGYPVVNITCDSLNGLNTFSDEYKSKSKEIETRLTEQTQSLAAKRFNSLYGEAEEKVNDAEKKLNEGKQKIADGETQLADGRVQLESKRAEGEAKLAEAHNKLLEYENLRQQGEATLAEARAKVAEAQSAMAEADLVKADIQSISNDANSYKATVDEQLKSGAITQQEYDAALDSYGATLTQRLQYYGNLLGIEIPVITHANYSAAAATVQSIFENFESIPIEYNGEMLTIGEARAKLIQGEQLLAAGEAEYNEKVAQLENGWVQYYAAQGELNQAVSVGEQSLATAEAQINSAKAQVAENEPKLEQAKKALADMKDSRCGVLPRSANAGVTQVSTLSNIMTNVSYSMAALFIIVGLLVSYAAVSRTVYEQIMQIGTKKALGLRSSEITMSFLLYSGIAVAVGAVIGAAMGVVVVQGIVGRVIGDMFIFGTYPPFFGVGLFVVVTLIEMVLILGATWAACHSILKLHAIELLRGPEPPGAKAHFYENWAVWSKLPLFTQTIINNCVYDKRRVFNTIIGVAGCTALIVTAFTLNNNVLKGFDKHYDDVYSFNAITYVKTSEDDSINQVTKELINQGASATPVVRKSFIMTQPDGERGMIRLVVSEDTSEFSNLYHINDVEDSADTFDLSAEGAWVSQGYAEHFGAKVGDLVVFENIGGSKYEVPILGFHEFLLIGHEMVMGRDYYEKVFHTDYKPTAIITNTNDKSVSDMNKALVGVKGFDSIVDDVETQSKQFDTLSRVSSTVVLVYGGLAVLMAIVVLLNLNVMFIEEKKRELIVLMINGFSIKDAKRYIYNDTIVLTIIGIIFGTILGCFMGSLAVAAVEPPTASFIKSVDWLAVLIGIVGSGVLAFIMSAIALKRIPRFNLTDINKL